ncbi:unnamed protein product [Knipowitschia caucasica]
MDPVDITDIVGGVIDTSLSIGSLVAKVIPTHRACSVELSNDTSAYSLCNPCVFVKSGHCSTPLPPVILPSTPATAQFSKTPYRAHGSAGVFTYDVCDAARNVLAKVVVMFKVPFNKKKNPIMYGVGLFDVNRPCDCELYTEMSKNIGPFVSGRAKGPSLVYKGLNLSILASMSDCYTPVMKLHVMEE